MEFEELQWRSLNERSTSWPESWLLIYFYKDMQRGWQKPGQCALSWHIMTRNAFWFSNLIEKHLIIDNTYENQEVFWVPWVPLLPLLRRKMNSCSKLNFTYSMIQAFYIQHQVNHFYSPMEPSGWIIWDNYYICILLIWKFVRI